MRGIGQRLRDRQRRPARAGRGDPLMPAERKPAFEVSLHRKRVGLHEPGAVLILACRAGTPRPSGTRRRSAGRRPRAARRARGPWHTHRATVRANCDQPPPASCRSRISLMAAATRGRGASVQTRPIRRIASFFRRRRLGGEQPLPGARCRLSVISFLRPGSGYDFNPPAAIAVWLMVLYSDGGRLSPLPSQRPSGIWRAISQWVIVAVTVSSGCPSAASAICA